MALNNLSGDLAPQLGSAFRNLETLYLGENQFTGRIPRSVANISGLKQLDINSNGFTGLVPDDLGKLRNLLLFDIHGTELPKCFDETATKKCNGLSKKSIVVIIISLSLASVSVAFIAILCCRKQLRKDMIPLSMQRDSLFQVSYKELVEATNGFSALNFLVDYLHRHCQTPIVHRDLKPSNVLLDDDMVAHVGDFGMAKLLSDAASNLDNQQATSSIIKGTIGYLAPECGMGGPTSPEGDIYSYGILVLEMITGKRPTDDLFGDGDQNQKRRGRNMLDCLASFTNVGVACSVEVPVERMKIEDVVTDLHAIKARLLEIEV
ncbi:hypothetical protein V6N13_060749 [Hibiscus sabdariffa]